MNLHQKLVEIRKEVVWFNKDTKGYGYSYVSGSQAIGKIRNKMDELGVMLIPSIGTTDTSTYDYKNSKGEDKTDFIVEGDMYYTWINAENPEEKLEIAWKIYGAQDDISKAFGSGLTYAERYFILKFFQAPTDSDDPDARNTSDRKNGTKKGNYGLSEAQIKRAYAIASKAGYNNAQLVSLVMKKYNKPLEQLTREEYNHVCNGLEGKQ